jgi:hypothetical protein
MKIEHCAGGLDEYVQASGLPGMWREARKECSTRELKQNFHQQMLKDGDFF